MQTSADPVRRAFFRYARWLVAMSWTRFAVLSLLALLLAVLLARLVAWIDEEALAADLRRDEAALQRRAGAIEREAAMPAAPTAPPTATTSGAPALPTAPAPSDAIVSIERDGVHVRPRGQPVPPGAYDVTTAIEIARANVAAAMRQADEARVEAGRDADLALPLASDVPVTPRWHRSADYVPNIVAVLIAVSAAIKLGWRA